MIYYFSLSIVCTLLLLPTHSRAQDSLRSRMVGVWTVEKMEIITQRKLTPLLLRKVNATRKKLTKNNNDIAADSLVLRLELRNDSTYTYKQTFAKQVQYFERGMWFMHDSLMKAKNLTHTTERSSIEDEKTIELNNERWVVEFTVFGKHSGITERVTYKRKQHH